MQGTQLLSPSREDPLEKEMAAHSSILAWRIPWREEPGRLQSMGSQRVRHDWATSLTHSLIVVNSSSVINSWTWMVLTVSGLTWPWHWDEFSWDASMCWEWVSHLNSCLSSLFIAQQQWHCKAGGNAHVCHLYWPIPELLAWRIPWTDEPGGLQSTGSQRVRHDWATSLSLSFLNFTAIK